MGFFRRAKTKFEYRRPRAEAAPEGWRVAEAVVDASEAEETSLSLGGNDGGARTRIYQTQATYLVLGEDGRPLPITVEAKLRSGDLPQLGKRLTVAYDPAEPSTMVVLLDEQAYGDRQRARVRHAIAHGVEGACEVIAARPTGRVAQPARAPEVQLTLRVTPPAGEPFEVPTTLWDRGFALAPGAGGTFIYTDDERRLGYPVFPDAEQRAAGADAVRLARDEFVQLLSGGTVQVAPGLTISSGGSTPLDI